MAAPLSSKPMVHAGEASDDRVSTVSNNNQNYGALVWRRFRRSVPGMVGAILVISMLVISVFADFFAPMNPREPSIAFAPPDKVGFHVPDEGWRLRPVAFPIVEDPDLLDPVTFQPLIGPDYKNPRRLTFFAQGWDYKLLGLIPASRHFMQVEDGSPLHILGTDKLGRDILSRGIVGSRISLAIALISVGLITALGTLLGIASGYIGGKFDMWFQRFV